MLMEYKPVARLILGYGELFIYVIIVRRLPEYVLCVLDEVRDNLKGILIRKITPMCMFILTVIVFNRS